MTQQTPAMRVAAMTAATIINVSLAGMRVLAVTKGKSAAMAAVKNPAGTDHARVKLVQRVHPLRCPPPVGLEVLQVMEVVVVVGAVTVPIPPVPEALEWAVWM